MATQTQLIKNLSQHLFWDTGKKGVDPIKNKSFIVSRVMEYGLLPDWNLIYSYYGIKEIAQSAITLKGLDIKAATFISLLSDIPIEQFACYTSKLSMPEHWNF